jgi:hypothetical protein
VLRTERLEREPGRSAYRVEEAGRYLRYRAGWINLLA